MGAKWRNCKKNHGGGRRKLLSSDQTDQILSWIEEDTQMTLYQLAAKVKESFDIELSAVTIHKYLQSRFITLKKTHVQISSMNSSINKQLRREYVEKVSEYIQQQKNVIWMNETNYNIFCRWSQGRSREGQRALMEMFGSKGPNVHVQLYM